MNGAAGATGATGATGTGINWNAAPWSSAATYNLDDAVFYNGSSYVSLQGSNTNNEPDTAAGLLDAFGATRRRWLTGRGSGWPDRKPAPPERPAQPARLVRMDRVRLDRLVQPGANGATGATGPAGSNGSNGATGATGQGFNFRGAWTASTAYNPYDVVTNGGQTYETAVAFTSGLTFAADGSNWTLWSAKGATGSTGPMDRPARPVRPARTVPPEQLERPDRQERPARPVRLDSRVGPAY